MARRKRRPGGGRKATGPYAGKTERFSTRIMRETREAIEREARLMGAGVSQAAESLLRLAVRVKREEERDRAMRALNFVIAETAHQVVGLHALDERGKEHAIFNWRTNPFFFKAFKMAVGKVLDALEPRGDKQPPSIEFSDIDKKMQFLLTGTLVDSFNSPKARAEYAANSILSMLAAAPRMSSDERKKERQFLDEMGVPSWWREFYGMPDAARDLEIATDKQPTKIKSKRIYPTS